MTKVITYASPTGNVVHLTPHQIETLRDARKWPRDPYTGMEFCTVSWGLHVGEPTFDDEEIVSMIA